MTNCSEVLAAPRGYSSSAAWNSNTMVQKVRALVARYQVIALAALAALVVAGPSLASPPTMDYAAAFTGGKTELIGALTVILPLALGLIGLMAGIGFAIRLFKRAAPALSSA